jgi:short-subunit dehydrogenase
MNIVITGATSGIGKELARHYAQPGTTLGLIGRRPGLLDVVARQCQEQGARVVSETIDVCDTAAMRHYAERFVVQADGIDIVVANAGTGAPDRVISGDAAYHTRLFEVNVIGLLNTLLPFVPPMLQQRRGQLVAISSVAGFRALPGSTTYAATKVAVRTLMEGYGWVLRPHGISLTTINPGFVATALTAENAFPMPFLQPADVAARKIARAIARRRRVYTFPWPMAVVARLLPYIPGAILHRIRG